MKMRMLLAWSVAVAAASFTAGARWMHRRWMDSYEKREKDGADDARAH